MRSRPDPVGLAGLQLYQEDGGLVFYFTLSLIRGKEGFKRRG